MLILSFAIPVLLWLMAIAICGVFPFGDSTLLTSDMYLQYTWYFEFLQNILQNGLDLFYSFAYGLGSETISLIAYYLMSPLNFIVYFFSKENITEAILLINLIKIGLCGLSFGIFLKVKFNKKSWINIGFSTCYSLMAYNIVYQFNIMWLDGVILLPIIVLGIDRLFEKDKPALFYLSLLGGIITNWYIGWMLCIFSFIYAVYLVFPNLKENLKNFLKLIFVGILSAGSAMIVMLPTIYSQLQVESRKEIVIEALGNINFNVLDILSKFIIGSFNFGQITNEIYSEFLNLPNIYCGVFITFLVVLYFINKKVSKEAKIKDGLLLAIMFISVFVNAINIVWHGFSVNAWFPYRYSFIISFIMIIIAYKSYWKLDDIEDKSILKAFGIMALICCIIEKWEYEFLVEGAILVTLLILATYVFTFIRKKQCNYNIVIPLNFFICLELLLNSIIAFYVIGYINRNEIYEMEDNFNKSVKSITLNDSGYFRIENDNGIAPFQFGKNVMGLSNSSSTASVKGYKRLDSLGLDRDSLVTFNYNFTTKFNDAILGVKYFIGDGENSYYEEYNKENNIWINDDALALGFMADEKICSTKNIEELKDSFYNQNEIAKRLIKDGKEIFKRIEIPIIKKNNLIREKDRYYPESKLETSSIEFEIEVNDDKEIYLDVNGKGRIKERLKLYVDDEDILGEGKYLYDFNSINLGKFELGKKVNIKIKYLDSGEFPVKNVVAYYFDEEIYKDLISELKKNQLEISDMTNSRLSGKVNVTEDKDILLITFLYDKFIKIKVDGKEVEPFEVLDAFIGIKLTPGEHTVELWYEPTMLKVSGIISLVFIACSGTIILVWSKKKKRIK